MKNKLIVLIILSIIISCKKNIRNSNTKKQEVNAKLTLDIVKLKKNGIEAYKFCRLKEMNTDYCLLVDMKKHSGLYRLFIWDFNQHKITLKALVSHGCGEKPWGLTESKERVIFSNTPESHCSSKGKYKIGKRAYSQWGINIKYWLHGLELTNSNALRRVIVLHSWSNVGNQEVFPEGTPEGWGCPAVSNEVMRHLDSKLQHSLKPVLLWVFE